MPVEKILQVFGSNKETFEEAQDDLAGIQLQDTCVFAYIEPTSKGYRIASFHSGITDLQEDRIGQGQALLHADAKTLRLSQAAPKLYKSLLHVRNWLGQGDADPSFSGPIDEALKLANPGFDADNAILDYS